MTCQQDEGDAGSGGGREDNADLAARVAAKLQDPNERHHTHPGILTRRTIGDETGENTPSGVQTPTKMVRFPSSQ